jgi:hypothetical protein
MKEFFKINILIGLTFGTLFTIFANVVFEMTELKKLFLIAIGTIIATVISVLYNVVKALFEIAREGVRK